MAVAVIQKAQDKWDKENVLILLKRLGIGPIQVHVCMASVGWSDRFITSCMTAISLKRLGDSTEQPTAEARRLRGATMLSRTQLGMQRNRKSPKLSAS